MDAALHLVHRISHGRQHILEHITLKGLALEHLHATPFFLMWFLVLVQARLCHRRRRRHCPLRHLLRRPIQRHPCPRRRAPLRPCRRHHCPRLCLQHLRAEAPTRRHALRRVLLIRRLQSPPPRPRRRHPPRRRRHSRHRRNQPRPCDHKPSMDTSITQIRSMYQLPYASIKCFQLTFAPNWERTQFW